MIYKAGRQLSVFFLLRQSLRTSAGNAKNGITRSHWSRHSRAIAGYFVHFPCFIRRRRLVDRLQIRDHFLAILPGHVIHVGTHQVHNAQLHLGLRIQRFDRLRKTFHPVHAHQINIADAAVAQFGTGSRSGGLISCKHDEINCSASASFPLSFSE
jgi:hypothetical protein